MILIILMNALFAATFPLGKLALAYTGPLFLTGIRFILAGLILLSYYYGIDKSPKKTVARGDWLFFFTTSIFYVVLSYVPEFWALNYLSSFKTNMLWSSQPFLSALMGYFLLKERLTLTQFLGICIGTLGMVPIFMTSDALPVSGELLRIALPEIALTGAIIATVYAWFLIKRLLDKGYPLVLINGITMLMGGALCMAGAFATQQVGEPLYTDFALTLGYALVLIAISNIAGYGIYGKLLKQHSITFLSFSGFLCPIFGAVYGKFFMHETFDPLYLVAFVCIILGLYLFYKDELKLKKELRA